MKLNGPPQDNEQEKKIDYLAVLRSIERNNGRLKIIAQKFLARPDLLAIVPAKMNKELNAYGVNSVVETDTKNLGIKGVTINPSHMTEEVAIHELVHFFSMPALNTAFMAEQKGELDRLAENVSTYWFKTKALWNHVKGNRYEATNTHSTVDDITEFAVNFTNQQSEEKLKALNAYLALIDTFFEYYNSLGVREE